MTIDKKSMPCNKPRKSSRPNKKRMVKACSGGKKKLIHYGASGYGHNYSSAARKSFRARHKCDSAKDKLTARYWACKDLWTKGGDSKPCPKGRKCKTSSKKSRSSRKTSRSSRKTSRSRRKTSGSRRKKSGSRRKKSSKTSRSRRKSKSRS